MVFTVQKELALRIISKPDSKNYSSFSVLCQCFFYIRTHGDLSAGSFYPATDVVSTIIELKSKESAGNIVDRIFFLEFVKTIFQSRRKTMKNNILNNGRNLKYPVDTILKVMKREGVSERIRAEHLGVEKIISLCSRIAETAY